MNIDIEEIRMLSLKIAETFYKRLTNVLDNYQCSCVNEPKIVSLVYNQSFSTLQNDADISVATRAAFLKSLSGKFNSNMFEVEFRGSQKLPMEQLTEDLFNQIWDRIESAYTSMLPVPNADMNDSAVQRSRARTAKIG